MTARRSKRKLGELVDLIGTLGLPSAVVQMTDDAPQKNLWEVRKAGLNIMMSLKGDGKPVSFIGLRGAARTSGRLHRAVDRSVRATRHPRHLVRARQCGHAARAPDPRHAPRWPGGWRSENARHRR